MHKKFSRYKTIFHSAQQAFEIQNKFSRCTTNFRDTVDTYVEQNSVSRCKIKFHDAQQKFGTLVTSTGNFIPCDHTTSCPLPSCFVNTRATQLTMAASLLPTGDEKEIITYYFSRGYEYDAIVHFLAKFHDITMSVRTLKTDGLRRYQLRRRTPTYDLNLVREAILRELSGPGCSGVVTGVCGILSTCTTFKYQGKLWRILLDLVSLSRIIRLLHPSIQPWKGNPKGFNLSYSSTCHVWFGPGEEYRQLCNARDLLCSQPSGSSCQVPWYLNVVQVESMPHTPGTTTATRTTQLPQNCLAYQI